MFRPAMTGKLALALVEAMLMILATWASRPSLAWAGARIGRASAWGARPRHWFPQNDDAPTAPGRRRGGSMREVPPPPAPRSKGRMRVQPTLE